MPANDAAAALSAVHGALSRANTALLLGELDAMLEALEQSLDVLCSLAALGQTIRAQAEAPAPWDGPLMLRTVWQLLAQLHHARCQAFPFAGTLLGLERGGELLPGDKDADFAVWLEDFSLAVRVLEALGLQRLSAVPPFGNMASLVHADTGLVLDVFGMRREPEHGRIAGGVWLYGKPPSYQRITHYPWFGLMERHSPAGTVWWPDDANVLLTAMYGQWVTPVLEWDSSISNPSQNDFNTNWRCFALKSLAERWLRGDAQRTRRLLEQIAMRCGWDARMMRCLDALDAIIALTPPLQRG